MQSSLTTRLFKDIDITTIPSVGKSEDIQNPMVYAHLYHPINPNAHWLILELDTVANLAYGYVSLFNTPHENEIGYISIDELERISIHGYKVERDIFFNPCPLSEAKVQLKIY